MRAARTPWFSSSRMALMVVPAAGGGIAVGVPWLGVFGPDQTVEPPTLQAPPIAVAATPPVTQSQAS